MKKSDLRASKNAPHTFAIPIAVFAHGGGIRLVFRIKVDGKTPTSEIN